MNGVHLSGYSEVSQTKRSCGAFAIGRQNSGKSSSVHNSFTRVVCFADGFQRAKRETVYVCCERERARKERQCEKREHRRPHASA